jgi:hypothetical protein
LNGLERNMVDTTILISTVDAYAAAWPACCHGLTRYWTDRPWPVVWVTNWLTAPCGETIQTGDDPNWAHMMRRALETVTTPVIFFMLEDVWLAETVDTARLLDFAGLVARGAAEHIQLQSAPADPDWFEPEPFVADPRLLVYRQHAMSRVCLQPGLWRREVLLDLMTDKCKQPGDFEHIGTKRSWGRAGRYLCVKPYEYLRYVQYGQFVERDGDPVYWTNNPISGGHWTEGAREYAMYEGLEIDFSREPRGGFW